MTWTDWSTSSKRKWRASENRADGLEGWTAVRDTPEATLALLRFIHESPTPFHAVATTLAALTDAGFERLPESERWTLEPGGRYAVTRNGTTVGAFVIGSESPAEGGFHLVGAHTDSPNLRLKPMPELKRSGYHQVGIEVYGGVLLASWTDRDLGLAGRVVLGRGALARGTLGRGILGGGETVAGAEGLESRLVRFDRPLARVPQLAIHLNREVNEKGLLLNRETQMTPVLGLIATDGRGLIDWLAAELDVSPQEILGHELMFHDVTPPTVAGMHGDFIHAPRLDNLASCHAGLSALLAAIDRPSSATRGIVLYDNEEIGSATSQGAAGPFLDDLLERILVGLGGDAEATRRARARSFFISADMAHAVHPNFAELHASGHEPRLNGGPVIKINANARYATDAESAATFARLAQSVEVPVQRFAIRADLPCGSTIGPLVATRLGLKTVDVGNPMLSMHSCREMAGSQDHGMMIRVLTRFFEQERPLVA
ncbi:MAG: M18 family aminopeptidase [Candidatus Eisenbacteria bacterium]|nr:M18 family aminopeptidase [Candidatus Eisenbacteria bacterium]